MGAHAVYGPTPLLTYAEFNEAWTMQQVAVAHFAKQGTDEGRRDAGNRRTIALEERGILDAAEANPDAQRPAWMPVDPMDPGFDPFAVEDQVQHALAHPGSSGITS